MMRFSFKFVVLATKSQQKVISILGDEEKRAVYDHTTGCVDDDDQVGDAVQNLHTFSRAMYQKISEADIEKFETNYRGSDQEKKDLLDLFNKCKGDMNRHFCCMICSDHMLDSHRFKYIIDEAIYKEYYSIIVRGVDDNQNIRDMDQESVRNRTSYKSIKTQKEIKKSSDLYAMIARRQTKRKSKVDSMFSSLVQNIWWKRSSSRAN